MFLKFCDEAKACDSKDFQTPLQDAGGEKNVANSVSQ
jgi:hypothetical protein